MATLTLVQGDITKLEVDAIVNAANSTLLGGGGVDGAIHQAAGPELRKECETLGGCPNGSAKITKGYRLPAAWIIHTVGPVWHGGEQGEARLLSSCYRTSLEIANRYNVKSIAFPCISTGIYRFPKALAAEIAIRTVRESLGEIDTCTFVCFDTESANLYARALPSS